MGPTQSCPIQTSCPTQAPCPCLQTPVHLAMVGSQIIGKPATYPGSLDSVGNIISVGGANPSGNISLFTFDSLEYTTQTQNFASLNAHISLNITSNSNLSFQFISTEFNIQSTLILNPLTGLYTFTWNPSPISIYSNPVSIQFMIPQNSQLQQPTPGAIVVWNNTIDIY